MAVVSAHRSSWSRRPCGTGSRCSRPMSASTSSSWRGRPRRVGCSRSGSPSTPTSRSAGARRRPRATAELAEEYKRCLDPLVALAAAASATTTLRLGTGILLAAQREPIVTAKAVATLDHLSGGRAALGVGFGWNEDELEHHGVAMGDRRAVARELVLAMQALWADDEASFEGEHVRFSPSWSWPKPVQLGAGRPAPRAGAARRRAGTEAVRPHRRVRRRLDPDRRRRPDRRHPSAAGGGRRGRPRSRGAGDRALRLASPTRASSTTSSASASPSACSASRARPATSCSRSSTSRPPWSPAACERDLARRAARAAPHRAGRRAGARGRGGGVRPRRRSRPARPPPRGGRLRAAHRRALRRPRPVGRALRPSRGARGPRRRRGQLVDRAATRGTTVRRAATTPGGR